MQGRPQLHLGALRAQNDMLGGQLEAARVAALLNSQPTSFNLQTGLSGAAGLSLGPSPAGLNLNIGLPNLQQSAQQQLLPDQLLLNFPASALYATSQDHGSRKPTKSSDSRSSSAYASRHQAAEQRRRSRINERLELLRKLVPHAERANTACFLEEVIKYIESLKARTMELETLLEAATGKPAPKPSRPGLSAAASLLPSRNPSEAQGDGDQSPGLSTHGLAAAPAPAQQPTQSAPSAPAPAPSSPHGQQPLGTSAGSVSLSLSKQGQGASSGLHGSQQQQQLVASLQQQQCSGNNGSNPLPLSLLQLQQASGQQQLRELQLGQSSTMQQHAAMLQQVQAQAQAQQGSLSLSGLGHHGTQLSLSGLGSGSLTLPSGSSLSLALMQQQQHPQHHQSSQHQQVSQHLDLQSLQVMQQALQQQQQGRASLANAGATNSSGTGSVFQPSNNKAFLTFNEDLYNIKPDILTANAARSLQGLASATPSTSLQLTTTQLPADSNANTVGGDTSRRGMPGSPNTSEESGVPLKKRKVLMLT